MSAPDLADSAALTGHRTIEEMVESARLRIARLTPAQVKKDWDAGAVVVDIRPASQREAEGELHGALVIERNVRHPSSDRRDRRVRRLAQSALGLSEPAWLPRVRFPAQP